MPACRQCRVRKVRCDRQPGQCGGCVRLAVPCVYPAPTSSATYLSTTSAASATTAATPPSNLYSRFRLQLPSQPIKPQPDQSSTPSSAHQDDYGTYIGAGVKRRRSQRACLTCRKDKVKCNGEDPCSRCEIRKATCTWTSREARYPRLASPEAQNQGHCRLSPVSIEEDSAHINELDSSSSPTDGTTPNATAGNKERSFQDQNEATLRRYIDAYFHHGHTSGFMFPMLLKSLVIADWNSKRLHPMLLKSIVAYGVCLAHSNDDIDGGEGESPSTAYNPGLTIQDGQAWLTDVRKEILLTQLDTRPCLAMVQTLVILLRYYLLAGQERIASWNLLALAARFSFSLALNYEDNSDRLDATTREMRRRVVWAIYAIDRLLCGGIDDLSVCLQARIHIRLPCSEQSFQRGIHSRAPFVDGSGSLTQKATYVGHEDMDMLAYYLQLLGHRHRILQYTKRLRLSSTSPELSHSELLALQHDLTAFAEALPVHLQNTPQNMVLMAHATDADADWFLNLHTLFLQCHCDLYRHVVPNLREALRPEFIRLCSPAYITACQDACLNAAVASCRLWVDARRLDFARNGSRALFLVACIYQVGQILVHLRPSLHNNESNNRDASTPTATMPLAQSLQDALRLLGDSRFHATHLGKSYVCEIQAMIMLLQSPQDGAVASLPFDERKYSAKSSQRLISMSSRHSVIETLAGDMTEEAEERETMAVVGEKHNVSAASDHVQQRSSPHQSIVATAPQEEMFDTTRLGYGIDDGLLQEVIPWGVDEYFDPMLGFVGGDDGMMQPYPYDATSFGTGG